MKMTVIAYAPNGTTDAIDTIYKKYAIDMMKKISDYAVGMGHQPLDFEKLPGDWDWVMPESPIEIVDAVSWGWQTHAEGTGASGTAIYYVNAPVKEEFIGRTVFNLDHHGAKISLDILVE